MPECSPFSLRGKVIIQCGASGQLGRALVSALSAADATLTIASRNRPLLETIAAEERASGRTIDAESVDVTAEESIRMLRDRVLAKHQRIDGLVYNSVSRPMRAFGDDLSAWEISMATNATGLFATVRIFGNVMASQRTGSIVNIASIQGMVASNPWLYEGTDMTVPPDYFFHKGGMLNLTRALASHYGSQGVRVNAISPGGIYNSEHPQAPEFLRRYGQMTMLGRLAEAREISGAVVFLLSDAASYITGINLPVDGGYTAK